MPSIGSRLIPALVRVDPRVRAIASSGGAHRYIARCAVRPRPYGPPRKLRSDVKIAAERWRGWPVYTVTPSKQSSSGSIVYVHGGAWVNEISTARWRLVAQIAAEAGVAVTVPIYPLVPFATSAQVVPSIADLVLANESRYGNVCLAGDSAGGQIALSAAILLGHSDGLRLPRTVLISPALDLSFNNPEIESVQPSDPLLKRDAIRVAAEYWRGGLELNDPLVSPLYADLSVLGALSIFSSTRDILNPDARVLVDRAGAFGVEVEYHEQTGLMHDYPLTRTSEGRAGRCEIVNSLRMALANC